MRGGGKDFPVPVRQADATLVQANPVSDTLYTVLDTTKNCRIRSIQVKIIWATTQPTPLKITITIDGLTLFIIKLIRYPTVPILVFLKLKHQKPIREWILLIT